MRPSLLFIFLAFLLTSCGNQNSLDVSESSDTASSEIEEISDKNIQENDLNAIVSEGVEYKEFTREEYEKALKEGKTIFLNFYANWCPICKRERPDITEALSEIAREDLVAFEVNYNDSETDESEEEIAKQFQITYQHTKLIINKNEEVLFKTFESLNKEELKNKLLETK